MRVPDRPPVSKRVQALHDEYHEARPDDFDYWCVAAHGSDYSPKYLGGSICHDSMGEGFCDPDCNQCPAPCPIEPCPSKGPAGAYSA
jgi:hypothetical protein